MAPWLFAQHHTPKTSLFRHQIASSAHLIPRWAPVPGAARLPPVVPRPASTNGPRPPLRQGDGSCCPKPTEMPCPARFRSNPWERTLGTNGLQASDGFVARQNGGISGYIGISQRHERWTSRTLLTQSHPSARHKETKKVAPRNSEATPPSANHRDISFPKVRSNFVICVWNLVVPLHSVNHVLRKYLKIDDFFYQRASAPLYSTLPYSVLLYSAPLKCS